MRGLGELYFMQAEGGSGPIKVGFSIHPTNRMREIQATAPERLRVLYSFAAPAIAEPYAHEILKAHRVRGEWFDNHPFVLTFIDQIRASGEIAGCPADIPHDPRGMTALHLDFDAIVPRVWATIQDARQATGLTHTQKSPIASRRLLCRLVIAARKRGVNLQTQDLVRISNVVGTRQISSRMPQLPVALQTKDVA